MVHHAQFTLSQDALSQHGKVGCKNWHIASTYSAAGGEHELQSNIIARASAQAYFKKYLNSLLPNILLPNCNTEVAHSTLNEIGNRAVLEI